MQLTFNVDEQAISLSVEEVEFIVKDYFSNKTTEMANLVEGPSENKWFDINLSTINRKLFEVEREDLQQEALRQKILMVFAEADANPDKYERPFQVLIPQKTWLSGKTIKEMQAISEERGHGMASISQYFLKLAQRISNGGGSDEIWQAMCNNPDTANWHRIVKVSNDYCKQVGGVSFNRTYSPSNVFPNDWKERDILQHAVPLIMKRR